MASPIRYAALSNTPEQITGGGTFASGVFGDIESIEATNPDASAGAYVKLYQSTTTPDGSSVPVYSGFIASNSGRTLPVFSGGAYWWIAVATEPGAGLSAPATAFQVTVMFERRR